jgi:hypothetical protein
VERTRQRASLAAPVPGARVIIPYLNSGIKLHLPNLKPDA